MKQFFKRIASKFENRVLGALLIGVGVAVGGYFICSGICHFADKDRCVEARGLAEMDVLANRVTWPINVAFNSRSAQAAFDTVIAKKDTLVKFLVDNGIADSCISISSVNVDECTDGDGKKREPVSYNASMTVTVISSDVKNVMELMNKQSDLQKHGLCVMTRDYEVRYDLVGLPDLKPQMVEEATKDARRVAEKFAEDANCELGSICSAKQGQFSVEEDYYRPQYKKVRVVTTISYYLK